MIRSLRVKFIVLLFAVVAIALSAAFLLRDLMLKDFHSYLEGEGEDRVYWVTAYLERSFEQHGRWDRTSLADEAVRALLMGFDVQVLDDNGSVVMDTTEALGTLSPLMRRRVEALTEQHPPRGSLSYLPYPLFLAGKEIGTLEVHYREPGRNALYTNQSRLFLLWSIVVLGGIAMLLSIVASGALTLSLKRLSLATAAVGRGELAARVPVKGGDEIAALAGAFNRMAETLAVQEALRKKVITNLAHELRTPLGAMRGELEGMMDGVIPLGREQVISLHEEAGRLQRMIEGIEELAQAQASSLTLRSERIALGPFLEGIADRMRRATGEKAIALKVTCAPGTTAFADPERLSQVLLNLLTNAVRATGAGGRIEVRGFARGANTVLQVADTGRGIDPKSLPFIFERFFRSPDGGLGLGLAIVKELVEAHHGSIAVDSSQGKGSTFSVTLPGASVHNSS